MVLAAGSRGARDLRRLVVAFLVALGLLAGVTWLGWRQTARMEATTAWVAHTYEAQADLSRLQALVEHTVTDARGFALTGDLGFLDSLGSDLDALASQQSRLGELISDPQLRAALRDLAPLIAERLTISRRLIDLRGSEGLDTAREAVASRKGEEVLTQIRTIFERMGERQRRLLAERTDVARREAEWVRSLTLAGVGLGFALLLAVFTFLLRENRLRRQAEETSGRTLALLDGTRDGAFIFDPETLRFSFVNQGAVEQVGFSRGELLTMTPLEITPEFDEPRFRALLEPLLSGASLSQTFITVHRRRDGTEVPVEVVLQSVAESSESRSLVAIARDVSERRQAEAERDRIFALSLDLLCIADLEGYFRRVNPAFSQTLGYTMEELLARPFLDFVHPEDRAATLAEMGKLRQGVPTLHFENRYRCKDGSWKWLSWRAQPVVHEGLLYATARDVTESRLIQERLRDANAFLDSVVENIPNMVFVKDASDLRFVRFNRAGETLLGYSRDQLLGRNDYDFFPKEEADFFTAKDREVLARGSLLDIPEEEIDCRDGVKRILHTQKLPLLDETGRPKYLLGISEDITDRKQAEERVRSLNRNLAERAEELNAINKELESFSYSVSHDLRAPLRHIQGYAELLTSVLRSELPDNANHYISTIIDAASEMGRLIDDLLAFSRTGRSELRERRCALDGLVKEVVRELELEVQGRKIVWRIHPLPEVLGDPALLKQALANLIGNALKYSRGRDPAEIEIGHAGEESERAVIYVRDNGAGFDMAYAHKLFGVFQRLHHADEFEGTGIGLATVRRIIARHGGRTWAEGEPNRGATFYFTLKPAAPG